MVLLAWQRHFLDGPLAGISVELFLACSRTSAEDIVARGSVKYRSLTGGVVRDTSHRICPLEVRL
jgi:hypothetical protein